MTTNTVSNTQKRRIHSRAPTRIDLAGGTVDIWPLYLFLKNPVTINLGISLYAEAILETNPVGSSSAEEPGVILRSQDQNKEFRFSWKELHNEHTAVPSGLELHYKLLRYFYEKRLKNQSDSTDGGMTHNMVLQTRAQSPAGAGLGGSSTLSIALIGALASWASAATGEAAVIPSRNGEDFIEIVRDVETTVIQVPAGLQDYYGAMFGGLQSIEWGPGKHLRKKLPEDLISELEGRLMLFYSGQSRNSGINNWVLFKNFIDRNANVRSQFQQISDATVKLEKALLSRDWTAVGEAIAQEWQVRKTLANGITTPQIDQAFAEAEKLGPVSGKICGAGGGGCFFIYLGESNATKRSDLRKKIQTLFQDMGIQSLNFQATRRGLEVRHEGEKEGGKEIHREIRKPRGT